MLKKSFLVIMLLLVMAIAGAADEFSLLNEEKIGDFGLGLSEKDLKGKIPCPLKRGKEDLSEVDGNYEQLWDYPACGLSFYMSSEKKGGSKTISSITVTSPSKLKTKRGIQIGDSEQAVIQAYQHEKDAESTVPTKEFVAGSIYGGLIFQFQNNQVISIFLGAAAE
jgi:hypothetical protein